MSKIIPNSSHSPFLYFGFDPRSEGPTVGSTGSALSWLLPSTLLGLHLQLGQGVEKRAESPYCLRWLWPSWAVNGLGPSGCPYTACLGATKPFPPGAVKSSAIRPLRQSSGQMSPARLPSWVLIWHIEDPPIPVPAGILVLHSRAGCLLLSPDAVAQKWISKALHKELPSRGTRVCSPFS